MFVISGVTGNVGSVAARELLSKGHKVKVIVRDAVKGAAWSKQGAEVAVGSLDDAGFLTQALTGAKGFFAMVPPPPVTTLDFYGDQNKTIYGISAAIKAAQLPFVVLLSSIGADLSTGNGPIKGLHRMESALRDSGRKWVAIRAGFFQENTGNLLAAAKGAGIYPSFMPNPYIAMSRVATKDIGKLASEVLINEPHHSEIIDLQGSPYSDREIAEKLGTALGKKLSVVTIPEAGWIGAMTQAGMSKHLAEVYAEMYHGASSGIFQLKGDRAVQATTPIDDVIKTLTT